MSLCFHLKGNISQILILYISLTIGWGLLLLILGTAIYLMKNCLLITLEMSIKSRQLKCIRRPHQQQPFLKRFV